MSLKKALKSGKFTVTAEVGPPKGTDVAEMLKNARLLKDKVDAINITDNQSAVMRMCTLAAGKLILDEGVDIVYQMTCRDRNRLALQSDLLGASVFGMKNVLSLTGDHVNAGDHEDAKAVYDIESVQLLNLIRLLNSGKDMAGNDLHGATDFYPGAVVTPESEPIEPQLWKFERKVKAGARFFQTQAVYDLNKFEEFMKVARKYDVKILAGILLLKSAGMAKFLNKFVPGITVKEELIEELSSVEDQSRKGIEIAVRLIKSLKGLCDGVHVMAIGAEEKVPEILEAASL